MKKTAAFVLAILASLAFLVNPGFGALPRYEITDLGTLGGGYGYAGAIDNAAALAGDSCIIDSVNADEIQVPNAFWSASELGWLYTPGFSYILTGVLTNLGNSHIDGTSPLVTLEVYDGLPVEDANLLRSAQFHPADRSWAGGHFDPLVLTAGEHYFIGFRNVKDLWASHSYDGVPLPIYYGYDNDGTYPFTENGDVEYAMLKFQGTHIHPLRVPADYPTIQAAIDAAIDGDTVLVAEGTYFENINFKGKNIILRSTDPTNSDIVNSTTIDGVVCFRGTEDPTCTLSGFNIDGYIVGFDYHYGQDHTNATISYCLLVQNATPCDPAIFACDGTISNCVISQVDTICRAIVPEIKGCHGLIKNCTMVNITGGIEILDGGSCTIENCIIYHIARVFVPSEATVNISYCDLQGGLAGIFGGGIVNWGSGNIDTDPCFVSPGYWDANGVWVEGDYHLLPDSPCIDAGDPNYVADPKETDLDGRPRVIGGRIDMGAFEYSPPILAEVRIVPRTINLTSKGKWITCYICFSEDYDVVDIDPNSIVLEDEIQAQSLWLDEEEQVAIAKLKRSDVQGILEVGEVELTVTGQLLDGTVFEGTDVIRVIDKGGRKSTK